MRRGDRGVALLLVLAAVALLSAIAVELASRAGSGTMRASRSARDGAFRRLFDSGSEVTRGLLAEREAGPVTHWGQEWNREVKFSLGAGHDAIVRVADENGKLNIARAISHPEEASAVRDAVVRMFDYLARHSGKDANRIKGWSEKILRRLSSREPLLTLDGLREQAPELAEPAASELLFRHLTCFGDGTINLNTAPRAVLASLDPEFDDAMVERIAGFRGKNDGAPGAYKAFAEPQDLQLVEGIVNRSVGEDGKPRIDRSLYEKVQGLISVKSACFSGRIRATVDGHSREAWTFFKPSGGRLAFEELLP